MIKVPPSATVSLGCNVLSKLYTSWYVSGKKKKRHWVLHLRLSTLLQSRAVPYALYTDNNNDVLFAYKEPRKSSRKVSSQRTHWKKKKLFFKDSAGFMENASMGFYRWTHRNTLAPLAVKHFAHLLILNPQRRMNWKELADPFRLRATPKEGKQICKGRWIIS